MMVDTATLGHLNTAIRDAAARGSELHLTVDEVRALADVFDSLVSDPDLTQGAGQTLGEIAAAGHFGVWRHRQDIADGAAFAEQIRRQAERRE